MSRDRCERCPELTDPLRHDHPLVLQGFRPVDIGFCYRIATGIATRRGDHGRDRVGCACLHGLAHMR
jgi:hypothetical protein